VSRTIESAQTRVEGFNFDIRKRVVEFDDVINRQRETIYAERDKVLRNEDLTETVLGFLEDEIGVLVDTHTASQAPAEWDLDELAKALTAMGLSGPGTTPDDLADAADSRDALREHLEGLAIGALDAKEELYGDEAWGLAERFVLLRTIDSLWVEHLTEIDDMRRGIGLRGYAQQDPLNEFRREAFDLYEELRSLIRHGVASSIFRVTVTRQPAVTPGGDPAVAASLAAGAAALSGGNGRSRVAAGASAAPTAAIGAAASGPTDAPAMPAAGTPGSAIVKGALPAAPQAVKTSERLGDAPAAPGAASANGRTGSADGPALGFTPSGARIGRNDPCWCGSGQKYKRCHGR
jgi:preprotein translocase subunit SecA